MLITIVNNKFKHCYYAYSQELRWFLNENKVTITALIFQKKLVKINIDTDHL